MINLSVNVNKVATLRNSRGGRVPSVTAAVVTCLEAGAPGITVHPRADERHIRASDVREIAAVLAPWRSKGKAEYNIEGDPRPGLIDLAIETHCDQCTLVPVMPGEITSQAGWSPEAASGTLDRAIKRLKAAGVRVSLFVDPEEAPVRWAAGLGADRIELYTEPFAARLRVRRRRRTRVIRALRRGRRACARSRPGRERRPRSRPAQPPVVQDAAASRRSVDRSRARQSRAVGGPRALRPRLPRGRFVMIVPS